jgi:MazG family protein
MNPAPPDRPAPQPGTLDRALAVVRFLRAGCPWDAAQTPRSLTAYLLEESLELADAILEEADRDRLRSELGDLLLNLAFQVVLAEERGAFEAEDVVATLEDKMRRRHPHLYGDAEQRPDWEAHKARERDSDDVFKGLARNLDPLSRAQRAQDRAAGVGFDWDHARDAFLKVHEEVDEVAAHLESGETEALQQELGDLLFAVVNVARLSGLHAATALRVANLKFERRFARLTELARERGLVMGEATLAELDAIWDEVKRGEG